MQNAQITLEVLVVNVILDIQEMVLIVQVFLSFFFIYFYFYFFLFLFYYVDFFFFLNFLKKMKKNFFFFLKKKKTKKKKDINECTTNNGGCHEQAICINTLESFSCACKSGYSGNGFTCTGAFLFFLFHLLFFFFLFPWLLLNFWLLSISSNSMSTSINWKCKFFDDIRWKYSIREMW